MDLKILIINTNFRQAGLKIINNINNNNLVCKSYNKFIFEN